jgi:putative hydrolase of the HAD superfamily
MKRRTAATGHRPGGPVWLFDLDDTLHDAHNASMGPTILSMTDYIARLLDIPHDEATQLRQHYWARYGATLLGLVRHHGVDASHFLEETHALPGLEERLRTHAHDRAVLRRLPGRKVIVTNAPRSYALRVLHALNLSNCFDRVISIDEMRMFGHLRPKPDARMLRRVAVMLKVQPSRCVLVEDTLVHQRSAHRLGMRTVWTHRYLKGVENRPKVGVHPCRKPPYVYARIRALRSLYALTSTFTSPR